MSFWDQLRARLAKFMQGRNGMDEIVTVLLWAWPVLYILGLLTRQALLILLADALLIYLVFRMLSRNTQKRQEECAWFRQKTQPLRREARERRAMLKNRKQYVYFSCPQCKAKLRVPRGVGQITVTCKKCGNRFEKKA